MKSLTCTKTFCSKTRLSSDVNSHAGEPGSTVPSTTSGRSKNRYKHFTIVDGKLAAVIQSTKLSSPDDSMFNVVNNIQPLLDSSVDSISKNFTILLLAASTNNAMGIFLHDEELKETKKLIAQIKLVL